MTRICVQWPRLGPLHIARLKAVAHRCAAEGAELVVLETAPADRLYAWNRPDDEDELTRFVAFPDRVYEEIAPSEMRRRTREILADINPSALAISSYSTPDALAGLEWCRDHRRPAIIMYESREEDATRSPRREQIKRLLVSEFDAAVVSGTPQRRYLTRLGFHPDRIFQTASTIDNRYFREAAARIRASGDRPGLPGLSDPSPFFLSSNRFIERKNLPRLVEAYGRYRSLTPDPWRLVMLGDGPVRNDVERVISEHRIAGVTLAGFQQIDLLPAYYAWASVFVHPATVDQWGLVVNEAMASRLPVLVSTGAGCHEDLVHEDMNGFTFDPANTDELASRLHQIAHSGLDLAAMGAASEAIIQDFDLHAFADGLWAAYQVGAKTAERGMSPSARIVFRLLRLAQRHPRAFHTVES